MDSSKSLDSCGVCDGKNDKCSATIGSITTLPKEGQSASVLEGGEGAEWAWMSPGTCLDVGPGGAWVAQGQECSLSTNELTTLHSRAALKSSDEPLRVFPNFTLFPCKNKIPLICPLTYGSR